MKNLGIFYLIFVILLSVIPCSDDIETHSLPSDPIRKIAHQKDANAENCTAICMCNCCGQSVIQPSLNVLEIKIPVLEIDKLSSNYQFSLTQSISNIWQPPKLS